MYKKADQQLPWATQFSNSFNGVVNNVQNWWNTATDPNKPAGSGWDAFGKIYTSNPYMASAMTLAGATGIASLLGAGGSSVSSDNAKNSSGNGILPLVIGGLGLAGLGYYGYNKYNQINDARQLKDIKDRGLFDIRNNTHKKLLASTKNLVNDRFAMAAGNLFAPNQTQELMQNKQLINDLNDRKQRNNLAQIMVVAENYNSGDKASGVRFYNYYDKSSPAIQGSIRKEYAKRYRKPEDTRSDDVFFTDTRRVQNPLATVYANLVR